MMNDASGQKMRMIRALAFWSALSLNLLGAAGTAFAAGTVAGTVISNQAAVDYSIGASTFSMNSNVSAFTVAEVLNVSLVWQDVLPGVSVTPGQTGRPLTFLITNTGNGSNRFSIASNDTVGGDQFDPAVTAIYLDSNGNGTYNTGIDSLYVPGTNDPALAPDASRAVFVLSTIPAAGLAQGDRGNVQATVTSLDGSGAPGAVIAGGGDGGTDAVVGATGGTASATGSYIVSSVNVSLLKSAVVSDPYGGNRPQTGATVRYTISVTVTGPGTAAGVTVSDPVPANTTYRPGTLRLNGALLSDAADADAGDVGGTMPGAVTVRLGDLTSASPGQTITFEVTIN